MSNFISNHHLKNHKEDEIPCLTGFSKVVFELVSSIFKGGWNNLLVRDGQKTFRNKIKEEFTTSVPIAPSNRKSTHLPPAKPAEFSNIPLPLNLVSSSKGNSFAKNKGKKPSNNNFFNKPSGPMCSYTQVSSTSNVQEILKLKENFPKLSDKKIEQIHKTMNNSNTPSKPCINMTTKGPSCKQIIIPMESDNSKKFLSTSSDHVTNINRALQGIKSDIIIDFIRSDYRGLIVISNKVTAPSDISIINKYVKNSNDLDVNDIQDAQLPQSKSYFKILGIPYLTENTNTPINSNVIESIIKASHIFNDIKIASKPRVCKVSPKSDMAIIWIDIWDSQNGVSAKKIINQSLNVRSFIATVRDANMNPGVPQCKNCWK